jgi:hypothetical protein
MGRVSSAVIVDVSFDPEIGSWWFYSEDPCLSGGGDQTREGACMHALDAVAFMLDLTAATVASRVTIRDSDAESLTGRP